MWSRMNLIFSLLVLTASTLVSGKDVDISDHPYQVSISNGTQHICDGSIVGPRKIVTAAHCINGTSPVLLRVRVGSSYTYTGGQVLYVEKVIEHPDFEKGMNAVSVIILSSDITHKYAKQIEMENVNETSREYPNGVVTGFKSNNVSQMQMMNVFDLSSSTCLQRCNISTIGVLCAKGTEKYLENSGGSLIVNNVLVGIVLTYRCQSTYTVVYTQVSKIRPFVDSIDSGVSPDYSTKVPILSTKVPILSTKVPIDSTMSNNSGSHFFEHFIILLLTSITIKYYI